MYYLLQENAQDDYLYHYRPEQPWPGWQLRHLQQPSRCHNQYPQPQTSSPTLGSVNISQTEET